MHYSITRLLNGHRISLSTNLLLLSVWCLGCGRPAPLTVDMPLHLEEYLDAATIVGSEVPDDIPEPVEWRFDQPQHEWKVARRSRARTRPVTLKRSDDALQLVLTEANRVGAPGNPTGLSGAIYVDLPYWKREDWSQVIVRARTDGKINNLTLGFNLRETPGPGNLERGPFQFVGETVNVIDGSDVQSYLMRADWSWGEWEGPWRQLGLEVTTTEPATLDILSVSVVPAATHYAGAAVGVRTEARQGLHRRTMYSHVPGTLGYTVRVPEAGRLDVNLGVLRDDIPVDFTIAATAESGKVETLLEETYADKSSWAPRTVDLSAFTGQTIALALTTDAQRPGAVALWAGPTISGKRTTEKPNVIFYIIDGGGADYMSVYGYNRPTTPNLERLAAEGATFEYAYSNSTWSKTSTPSFMTSLQHSVLGGYSSDSDQLPDQAVTMAEHFHRAGYQTGVFTSNVYAGTMSSLDRGVDVLREAGTEPNSASSPELHEDFWQWREAYPAEPYWVHFQTTDVHWPWKPVAPFAGLYVEAERRQRYYEWEREVGEVRGLPGPTWPNARTAPEIFEKIGISRQAFFSVGRDLYDETMTHNDHQLGRLVDRLKATGEWGHTLLIVAADHGTASHAGLLNPMPDRWGASYYSYAHRVPMIIVWPERIPAGVRIPGPVSMIDMLPTIVELAGLPAPEVLQGRSLAPVLLGRESWEPRPVILEEVYVSAETGELTGQIEVIDGRWIASLAIIPQSQDEAPPQEQRRPPLLLYDLWRNPHYGGSVHEKRPDLVEKYTAFLEAQWEAHQALAQYFTRSESIALTPEQLETLRALGYIQ